MRLSLVLAAAGMLGAAIVASPARADWDDGDGWQRHEFLEHRAEHRWHERQEEAERWREHEWRERQWHARAPEFYAPGAAYYVPPLQPYYAPRAYYAPRPIYAAPGVSVGFGFDFR